MTHTQQAGKGIPYLKNFGSRLYRKYFQLLADCKILLGHFEIFGFPDLTNLLNQMGLDI